MTNSTKLNTSKQREDEQAARDEAAEASVAFAAYEDKSYHRGIYCEAWDASTAYHAPQLAAVEGLLEALGFDYEYYAAKQHKCIDLLKDLKEALCQYRTAMAKGEDTK